MKKHTLEDLNSLSHFALARVLMERLRDVYSDAGLSFHRSERSSLLESITDCTSLEWKNEMIKTESVIAVARAKPPLEYVFDKRMQTSLRFMPPEFYACLVFEKLRAWYNTDALTDTAVRRSVSTKEKAIVEAIVRLLAVEEAAKKMVEEFNLSYTAGKLIEEGWERRIAYLAVKYNGTG
ncbi:MAG: hypothetical protein JWO00_85 [Candidatus Parcubacteria bacterium]|nr:hypothetical protein [Candidatus Parcubacteria bacterium]